MATESAGKGLGVGVSPSVSQETGRAPHYDFAIKDLDCGGFLLGFGIDGEPKSCAKVEVRDGCACCTSVWAADGDGHLFVKTLKRVRAEARARGWPVLYAHLVVGREDLKAVYERAGAVQVGYVMAMELEAEPQGRDAHETTGETPVPREEG